MPLLDVQNLTIAYHTRIGPVVAVNNVCFSLEKGRSLGIVGESGCGKTTIGMALLGLLPENGFVQNGRILFENKDLVALPAKALRALRWKKISMIFQAAMNALNPVHRVGDQIAEAIRLHNPEFSAARIRTEVKELLDLVDIPQKRVDDYPHQYSGGMKQRAVIAMALSCKPDLIIADEPTTALDVIVQAQILEKIKAFQRSLNIAAIVISHDIGVVAEVCHDIMVMYKGHMIECGKREEVFESPAHPYTIELLSSHLAIDSVFDFDSDMAENTHSVKRPLMPRACGYAEKCSHADGTCFTDPPVWHHISSTHRALCLKMTHNGQ